MWKAYYGFPTASVDSDVCMASRVGRVVQLQRSSRRYTVEYVDYVLDPRSIDLGLPLL